MRFSQLAAQDPITLTAVKEALGVDVHEQRLDAVEQAIASLPPSSTLFLLPDIANTPEDTPINGNVLTNDTTTTGVLRIMEYWISGRIGSVSAGVRTDIPGIGSFIMFSDGEWSFDPGLNYNGPVPLISFQVTNGSDVKVSSLTITVGAVDDSPVANPNSIMIAVNESIVFGVLGNDFDPEGQTVVLTEINGQSFQIDETITLTHGTVSVDANSQLHFTPETDYEGEFSFTYTVSDGNLSAQGTVYVQVGYDNIPLFSPVARLVEADYFDDACRNFGNTAMGRVGELYNNGVGVTDATYASSYGNFDLGAREPWLYDRATQIYKLYLRTQDPTIRTKALEYASLYMDGVVQTFDLADFRVGGGVAGDPKYLYPIIAWWYERETGDSRFREKARGLYNQAKASFSVQYSTSLALWTERNMNYALQACIAQYWLSGDQAALDHAEAYFETLVSMASASGAPLHPHGQHEGTGITTPVSSPWMTSMLAETLIQLYRTNGDTRIVTWIARYCDFLMQYGFYINNEVPEYMGLHLPAYLVGTTQIFPSDGGAWDDAEHSYDVSQLLLRGIWAKQQLNEDVISMQERVNELQVVARAVFDDWTRNTTGLPKYRVNPPRKYGWWFNAAYTKIYFAGVVPLGPINLVLAAITGERTVGSQLSVTPGTWAGSPAPTFTYQWLRDGIEIVGETGLNHTITEDDVGFQLTVMETATNVGGTIARASSNYVLPVAVGSPVITQQPQTALLPVGQDATFSVLADGTPAPDYQWFVKLKGGSSFTEIVGETTSSLTITAVTENASGNQYRCRVSNTGDTIFTSTVSLYVIKALNSIQFNGSEGATLTQSLLPPGAANFTIEALVRMDGSRLGDHRALTNRYIADRLVSLGTANNWPDHDVSIGDSMTGWPGGEFGFNPVEGEWYLMTLSADSVLDTGFFKGTIQSINGGTIYTVTRDKGIDGLLGHVGFEINGGGAASAGFSASYQYVRAYPSQRTPSEIESDLNSADVTDTLFWWVFEDNGVGGVTVRDATGNNRVPTIVGGILSSGPTAPIL